MLTWCIRVNVDILSTSREGCIKSGLVPRLPLQGCLHLGGHDAFGSHPTIAYVSLLHHHSTCNATARLEVESTKEKSLRRLAWVVRGPGQINGALAPNRSLIGGGEGEVGSSDSEREESGCDEKPESRSM